jgi:F-type H+-transporting ATPase subunit gamma
VTMITVGRKGTEFMHRSHMDILAEFTDISDRPGITETRPISQIIIGDYINGLFDEVYLAYNKFENTFTQKPSIDLLLPIVPASIPKEQTTEYIYEPDSKEVLGGLLPRFIEMKVYQSIMEAIASEHSARMVAMRNATENANELIDNLTLMLNKARQEMITTELLDITGGVENLQ